MKTFRVRCMTKVPVLWNMFVKAADAEEAKNVARDNAFIPQPESGSVIQDAWFSSTMYDEELTFDWEHDGGFEVVTIEEVTDV